MERKIAKITGEDNLQKAFEDVFHVLINVRAFTKEWENLYGREAKRKKKMWEEKADKLIEYLENGVYSPLHTPKRHSEIIKSKQDVHRDNKISE